MINNRIFVPWDLTFGSGMQTLGALVAVVTVGWAMQRGEAIRALSTGSERPVPIWLYYWIRWVIPGALLLVGVWWMLTDLLHLVRRCPVIHSGRRCDGTVASHSLGRSTRSALRGSPRFPTAMPVSVDQLAPHLRCAQGVRRRPGLGAARDVARASHPDGRGRSGDDAGASGEGRGRRRDLGGGASRRRRSRRC